MAELLSVGDLKVAIAQVNATSDLQPGTLREPEFSERENFRVGLAHILPIEVFITCSPLPLSRR